MEKTRGQYIEEAEKVYMRGKSVLAFNIINQLYMYLTDEDKAELASYLAKDIDTKQQAEIDNLTNLVKARDGMIAQMAERMEELDDKVSELTEALDASHIFCEGMKDAVVNKACDIICKYCHEPCPTLDKCDIIKEMKGE